jgi:large-conductance mechanosensitive channel
MSKKDSSLLDFVLRERLVTLTVICSIVTMQFISTFKVNLFDPLLDFAIPEEKIDFLNVTIRDGVAIDKYDTKKITLDFGQVLKEFVKWLFVIFLIYMLYIYTSLPDIPTGNPGVAVI